MRSSRLLALTALVWLLNAALACATSLTLTGAGPGSPGATPPTTALGVMFQSDTGLATTSTMNITNTTHWYYRLVVKGQQGVAGSPTTKTTWESPALLQAHSGDACEISAGTQRGQCSALDNSMGVNAQWSFNDATGTAPGSSHQILFKGDAVQAHINIPGVWNVYDFSCDTAAQVCAAALNGVNILGNWWTLANTVPLNMLTDFNTGGLAFLNSGTASFGFGFGEFSMDMYDTSQAPICLGTNTPATITGLGAVTCGVGSAGTFPPEFFATTLSSIPASPLAAGTAAIPADPGTSCTKYFGFTMSHCNIAGASTPVTDLPVEKGSATPLSALAYAAINTHGGTGFPSPFGPAGIPAHQATIRWLTWPGITGVGGTTVTTSKDANTIVDGANDLLVALGQGATGGTAPTDATCPPNSGGLTWTRLGNSAMRETAGGTAGNMYVVCTSPVPLGADVSGAYTLTWNATLARNKEWVLLDVANVASVDVANFIYNNPAVARHLTYSGTTACANGTLLSIWFNNDVQDAGAPWNFTNAFNSTTQGLFRVPDNGSPAVIMVGYEYGVASGSNTQRSATSFNGTSTDQSFGVALNLCPA